jgi:hypothetical protein
MIIPFAMALVQQETKFSSPQPRGDELLQKLCKKISVVAALVQEKTCSDNSKAKREPLAPDLL